MLFSKCIKDEKFSKLIETIALKS